MAAKKTLRALSRLLSYPNEQTVESAELLYVILQGELPDAAANISEFGDFVQASEVWELEEAFTATFDVNPACALEIGWHLFGEEYARGLFLVRLREEMRKYDIAESSELPDHITHALAVLVAMPEDEANRFAIACLLPAVRKMDAAMKDSQSPYRHVVAALGRVLHCEWGGDASYTAVLEHPDGDAIPAGVDRLHAFPVADVGCGGDCECSSKSNLVQLPFEHEGRE